MTNWIKPSELPPKFHGQCFVSYKHDFQSVIDGPWICMIQNYYRGTIPERWVEGFWSFMDDEHFRIMVIEYPKIIEGDFKRMVEIINKYKPILDDLHVQRYKDFADEQSMVGEQRAALFNMLGVKE